MSTLPNIIMNIFNHVEFDIFATTPVVIPLPVE